MSTTYLAFGRTEYAEPLRQVGALAAAAPDAAKAAVDDVGSHWVELTLLPADEIVWLLRSEEDA